MTRQSLPQPPFPCCLLSQNLTVLVASTLRLSAKSARSSSFSVSFSRFARRPPKPSSAASRGTLVSSGVCYYINFHPLCQPPFFLPLDHYIFPSTYAKPPVYRAFGPFLTPFAAKFRFVKSLRYSRFFSRCTGRAATAAAAVFPGAPPPPHRGRGQSPPPANRAWR